MPSSIPWRSKVSPTSSLKACSLKFLKTLAPTKMYPAWFSLSAVYACRPSTSAIAWSIFPPFLLPSPTKYCYSHSDLGRNLYHYYSKELPVRSGTDRGYLRGLLLPILHAMLVPQVKLGKLRQFTLLTNLIALIMGGVINI